MATASALQSPLQALPSFAFSTGTSGDSSFSFHGSDTCDEPARNVEGADVTCCDAGVASYATAVCCIKTTCCGGAAVDVIIDTVASDARDDAS